MGLIRFKVPEKGSKGIDGQTKYWFPATVSINDTVPDTVALTVSKNDTDTDTVVDTVPDTVIDTDGDTVPDTNNKLNQTKQNKKIDFDLSFVDIVFIPIVKDFIQYRKQIKKPYKTERGVQMFYNELKKLSGNNYQKALRLVEYAKGKEWQTVYQIKDENNKRNFERKPHSDEHL